MKKTLFGITWASFDNLWWAPALVAVGVLLFYWFKKRRAVIKQLVAYQHQALLFSGYSTNRLIIKKMLYCFTFVFLFLALLQPQWGKTEQVVVQEGRELFIALDISRSMLASDVKPHRLAFAKSKIKKLLQLLPSDRVGLMVFSGASVIQCPLTRDTSLFTMFLDQIDAESISSGTTAIDQALKKIIEMFKQLPARKHKTLVVFTDGEDFSRDLTSVKEEAQKIGLHIFTYGVGTEQGAPVPILNEQGLPVGYEKNEQGNVVLSRLNAGILAVLSAQTGGHSIAATQSDDDIKGLVSSVERYEKEMFEDKQLATQEERYPFFLGGALICMILEWLL